MLMEDIKIKYNECIKVVNSILSVASLPISELGTVWSSGPHSLLSAIHKKGSFIVLNC